MKMKFSRVAATLVAAVVATCATSFAQEVPAPYKDVLTLLGKSGDFKANVLKVNIPRNDLSMTIAGMRMPTPFGFGGWIAFTKGTSMDVMMGDLVLTQDEVNPVMSALVENGIDVTALHNHFFWDEPRVYFMHVHGHGAPIDLAKKVKPAIDLIGKGQTVAPSGAGTAPAQPGFDTAKIAKIVGHEGETSGAVYKITVGRDDLQIKEMGASINARMGLNTWAAFFGSDQQAVIAGDVAMLESEVQPVLKALRSHGLSVVAIHQHMTDTRPMIFFLHYWGKGSASDLAAGFRAALDQLGKNKSPANSTARR